MYQNLFFQIPEDNGYTVKLLNDRALPHIKQNGYDVEFRKPFEMDLNDDNFVKVSLLSWWAQRDWLFIQQLLETHYGLIFRCGR